MARNAAFFIGLKTLLDWNKSFTTGPNDELECWRICQFPFNDENWSWRKLMRLQYMVVIGLWTKYATQATSPLAETIRPYDTRCVTQTIPQPVSHSRHITTSWVTLVSTRPTWPSCNHTITTAFLTFMLSQIHGQTKRINPSWVWGQDREIQTLK